MPQDFIGLEYFQVLCSDRQDESLCATAEYFGCNCSRLVIANVPELCAEQPFALS